MKNEKGEKDSCLYMWGCARTRTDRMTGPLLLSSLIIICQTTGAWLEGGCLSTRLCWSFKIDLSLPKFTVIRIEKRMEDIASSGHVTFARALASPDKEIRDKTLLSLVSYASSLAEFTELEMLKLWKALYYCMWLSDKAPIQQELAGSISGLFHSFTNRDIALLYYRCFFRTMMREWSMLDQHRINKFYFLIRLMLREGMRSLHKTGWDVDSVNEVIDILEEEILIKTPNGLRFHISDIFLQELHVASKGDIDTDSFLLIIGPFLRAVQGTQDSAFFDRVSKKVFSAFVKSFGRENAVVMDSSEDESRRFGDVESKALQSFLFDMASDIDTSEKNRKKLYILHQEFPALTGEDFVTSEEMDEQQEEEEEEEIIVRKKTTKKIEKILETSDQKIKKVKKQVMDDVAVEETKVVVEEKVSSEIIDKKAAKEARKEAVKALKIAEELAVKKAADIEEAITTAAATAVAAAAAAAAAASKGNKIKKVKRTREELEEEDVEDVPVPKSKKEKVSKESSKAAVAAPVPVPVAAVKTVAAAVAVAPIVAASIPPPLEPYVAMKKFGGQKVNYVFKKGSLGLGYYIDKVQMKKQVKLDKIKADKIAASNGSNASAAGAGAGVKNGGGEITREENHARMKAIKQAKKDRRSSGSYPPANSVRVDDLTPLEGDKEVGLKADKKVRFGKEQSLGYLASINSLKTNPSPAHFSPHHSALKEKKPDSEVVQKRPPGSAGRTPGGKVTRQKASSYF